MKTRHVFVTGTSEPLGAAVAARLRRHRDVRVVEDRSHAHGYDDVARVVADQRIDTVIHARLVRWSPQIDADVISAMRLAAAVAQPGSAVRVVAAASSTSAYPATSRAPRLRREGEELNPGPNSVAARLLEAERYLQTLAEARPDMCVAILRLADLAGNPAQGPLAQLLRDGPVVPAIAGFDGSVQLLDIDDAAAALEHAASRSLAGVYNVAGAGTLPWAAAARLARKRVRPMLSPPPFIASFARQIKLPFPAPDTLDTLRYGRTVDTARLTATGFAPAKTSRACVAALAAR